MSISHALSHPSVFSIDFEDGDDDRDIYYFVNHSQQCPPRCKCPRYHAMRARARCVGKFEVDVKRYGAEEAEEARWKRIATARFRTNIGLDQGYRRPYFHDP
jgi:hypothetical protein